MNLHLALTVALAVLAAVLVALRVIAPLTKNKTDDEVLARLEALEELVKKLQG